MCYHKAFLITRTRIIHSDKTDDHNTLIKENGLDDTTEHPDFVRAEYNPVGANFMTDIADWKFKTDQDYRPDWYSEQEAEIACRPIVEQIIKNGMKTVGGNLNLDSLTKIPEGFNPTVGGDLYLGSLTEIPEGIKLTNVKGTVYLKT